MHSQSAPRMVGHRLRSSTSLLARAKNRQGAEADALYKAAEMKLSEAEAFKPGSASYNLACICSLNGKPNKSSDWLLKALEYNSLPSVDFITNDSDLDAVRAEKWFREIVLMTKTSSN